MYKYYVQKLNSRNYFAVSDFAALRTLPALPKRDLSVLSGRASALLAGSTIASLATQKIGKMHFEHVVTSNVSSFFADHGGKLRGHLYGGPPLI